MPKLILAASALALLAASCGSNAAEPQSLPGITAEGFSVTLVAENLDGPTQIAHAGDGALLVAQLSGAENDGTGEILLLDPATGAAETLFRDLLKPTGVETLGNEIWVMQERSLWRGPMAGGTLTVVVDDLPYNGRSEGTLTRLGDDELIYNTSGRLRGGAVASDSGRLWTIGASGTPEELATGFKNAYGHTVGADGTIWITEVSDGTFDGEKAADEVVEVQPGEDHGWPWCVGNNRDVAEFEAGPGGCDQVQKSQAVFVPGATPTSVAVAPWDDSLLVVALWVSGEIVTVPIDSSQLPNEPTVIVTGIERPQHLLADGNDLLVVDYGMGRIIRLSPNR